MRDEAMRGEARRGDARRVGGASERSERGGLEQPVKRAERVQSGATERAGAGVSMRVCEGEREQGKERVRTGVCLCGEVER